MWRTNLPFYFIFYYGFGLHGAFFAFAKFYGKIPSPKEVFAAKGNSLLKLITLWRYWPFVESLYSVLSVTSKTCLCVLVYTTVRIYLEFYAPCDARLPSTYTESTWNGVRISLGMVFPPVFAVVMLSVLLHICYGDFQPSLKAGALYYKPVINARFLKRPFIKL